METCGNVLANIGNFWQLIAVYSDLGELLATYGNEHTMSNVLWVMHVGWYCSVLGGNGSLLGGIGKVLGGTG